MGDVSLSDLPSSRQDDVITIHQSSPIEAPGGDSGALFHIGDGGSATSKSTHDFIGRILALGFVLGAARFLSRLWAGGDDPEDGRTIHDTSSQVGNSVSSTAA